MRRIALEVGRGQVVKQHVEARVEQRRPPVAQEREEVLLVRQQLVEAAIERVVGDRPIAAQQIAQSRCARTSDGEGATRCPGLSAGSRPGSSGCPAHRRALPARRQAWTPEAVQIKTVPQGQGQPARPPLAWLVQRHLRHVDLDHLAPQRRWPPDPRETAPSAGTATCPPPPRSSGTTPRAGCR